MEFTIKIENIYAKNITVEADDWQDALRQAIKDSDKGKYVMTDEDLKEENVSVKGWPYAIEDKWTVEDVDAFIAEHEDLQQQKITESEKRQALVFMKEHLDKSAGLNWKSLEIALLAVVKRRE
ncbi:hypothetical protein DWZ54_04980 [Mitsuokella sp. AF33-22]|uniref:hypothetical protein n=1 Tax=Mitsuokella sp. AF33-22 TaxID=2292047 RepID=UPI000E4ABCEE|nr:hypothetical protein [Mitsuokella sp. AF33-22]RHM55831.1 hypothetical protein DWZ54_04980 [Mitsuokella sp. AF33-22]